MINMLASKPMFLDSLLFSSSSGLTILLLTTCLLRGLFTQDIYNGTVMINDTKTISCIIRATYQTKIT